MIIPLNSDSATLETAGGKGANLAFLAGRGYPVPTGFIITTDAYRVYLAANGLQAKILTALDATPADDPDALEALSGRIRGWFDGGDLPAGLEAAIRQVYAGLGAPPVAVRSSATAEDLPGLSFAGQQDTFLNVVGAEAVLRAVVRCWSSLWTARAIGYRARNRVDQGGAALAVVVQAMIPSVASGVMFTADPVSGLRTQVVIEATLGLGEALVSGQVEPDRYVVDLDTGKVASLTLGAKAIAIHGQDGGGTVTIRQEAGGQPAGLKQALPDEEILSLARLGNRVMADYGFPQDIEWAWAGGKLYLLQSRPVTALYPLPEGYTPDDLRVAFSFGAVQGMLEPMTPMGQDAIRLLFSGLASLLGIKVNYETLGALRTAGERLWVDITPILKNSVGREAARGVSTVIEPAIGQALELVLDDPRLQPTRRGLRLVTARRLSKLVLPVLSRNLGIMINPDKGRERGLAKAEQLLAGIFAKSQSIEGDWQSRLAQRVGLFFQVRERFPKIGLNFLPPTAGGVALFNIINQVAINAPAEGDRRQEIRDLALQISQGMPHSVTTEMGLHLWRVAQVIRNDPSSASRFAADDPPGLAADYLAGRLPPAAQQALAGFIEQYGFRGLAEIDMGRPRWREDPTQVMETLLGYLQIDNPAQAPDAAFERAAQAAQAAIPRLVEALRQTPSGWKKAFFVQHAAPRMRALAGLRETPKFFIIRVMGILRRGLLESGHDLAAAGLLERPDDIFFLHIKELEALAQGENRDWKALVADRREKFDREKQRRQIPRVLLSDGRAFYEGILSVQQSGELAGSPVSPGVVEGAARVVLDPRNARLAPGEILVCPGTDPTWTPLFQTAGGLVMEVGGLMTHGAVVAREYGIPAVVGVDRATERIKTGQRLRVNGSTGQVSLVDVS